MTRKQQRSRHCLAWLAVIAAGASAAVWLAASGSPAGQAGAFAVMVLAVVAGHQLMILPQGTAILTYHSVSPDPGWLPWSREIAVHPSTFETHLQTLRAMGASVLSTRDYLARRHAGAAMPPRPVVLHFDDGYFDNWSHAVPRLRQYGFPGTFFASLDFIAPGDKVRKPGDEPGYMNWAELKAIDEQPGLEVEPHGVDHARHPVSDRAVAVLTEQNWRQHLWLQWAASPGAKHDWFTRGPAWAVPFGSPVPESAMTLASAAWIGDRHEQPAQVLARLERDLGNCQDRFGQMLGRAPQVFCWPENKAAPGAQTIALELGYAATTGGNQRNCAHEPADVLSRIHIGDRAIGFRWQWAEALNLRASVRTMQGNLYWYLPLAVMSAVRRCVFAVRARSGEEFA